MFIEVTKVVEEKEKTTDGSEIRNPANGSSPLGYKLQQEFIRVEEIRSFRHWTKNKKQDIEVEGQMTILYMFSTNKDKTKSPEILINESKDSFAKRLNAIPLSDEEEV